MFCNVCFRYSVCECFLKIISWKLIKFAVDLGLSDYQNRFLLFSADDLLVGICSWCNGL